MATISLTNTSQYEAMKSDLTKLITNFVDDDSNQIIDKVYDATWREVPQLGVEVVNGIFAIERSNESRLDRSKYEVELECWIAFQSTSDFTTTMNQILSALQLHLVSNSLTSDIDSRNLAGQFTIIDIERDQTPPSIFPQNMKSGTFYFAKLTLIYTKHGF